MKTVHIGPAPRLAVDVAGDGPLLLFLHGIGGNRTNWREQLPLFGRRFTAVAWDARGYGESDDYPGYLKFGDFSQDVCRVLDHFGAEKAHLVGLSMGARIALDFYGRYPQRVASLVFADVSVANRGADKEKLAEEALRQRKRPLVVEGKTPADIAPDLAQKLAGPEATPAQFQRIVDSIAALRVESYLKTLDVAVYYDEFPPFASITAPCLVVTGEHDPLATPPICRRMADEIPAARFEIIPGAGHMSNIENPTVFNEIVMGFLEER